VTIEQLRVAFTRTFRAHGVPADAEFLNELVSIADHHAAEEAAAAVSEGEMTSP
jgi:hypothetical protein